MTTAKKGKTVSEAVSTLPKLLPRPDYTKGPISRNKPPLAGNKTLRQSKDPREYREDVLEG